MQHMHHLYIHHNKTREDQVVNFEIKCHAMKITNLSQQNRIDFSTPQNTQNITKIKNFIKKKSQDLLKETKSICETQNLTHLFLQNP